MDRFFLSPASWHGPLSLTGDEAHHCRRVMRKKEGDLVEIFDGAGRAAEALISGITSNSIALEIRKTKESPPQSPQIEVAVGVPKGKIFDLIIQKAVELGVARIQPLVTDQGNVRISDKDQSAKLDKWQRVALEACKQCGQNHLPEMLAAEELSSWLASKNDATKIVAALQPGTRAMRSVLEEHGKAPAVTLLVGPEGDFSTQEYVEISRAGFAPVTLGDLVLRTETAVFAMISAVRYQFQTDPK